MISVWFLVNAVSAVRSDNTVTSWGGVLLDHVTNISDTRIGVGITANEQKVLLLYFLIRLNSYDQNEKNELNSQEQIEIYSVAAIQR